ncbi:MULTISPECIES: hypothetical protein [unclassified Polaribacter]|uniref:hypothetical protein n=1 Tax=unclassified Polaribacter TaxID=196858 RepID=UPI0011BF287F|nr:MULTISPECIES: hypothetical protein [unclassified Polaribacter]TXD54386.1 hypothetical protein ES043_00620 [Polaribacter sp. IC063]TXD62783.1 hypothetical protein ES044_00140 [Polaribacter sp. IC066]
MKIYNQTNFFKHTFCEFLQVDTFTFPENENYKSKSESIYFYTGEGVYRKSNHWGRVANCRWKLLAKKNYKNQQTVTGFAKWTEFYPINSTEKIFYIDVNFEEKTAKIQSNTANSTNYAFTFSDAQKKIKQIQHLFKDDKWVKYFNLEINELQNQIISKFVNSEKSLQEIKRNFK